MCEGLSKISGPIPPHPMFLKEFSSMSLVSSRSNNNSICEGPSKISGPIPPTFGYETEEEKERRIRLDYMKNPRVRDQGKANFEANKNGTGVGLLIELDGRSTIPQTYKARKPPRNHIALNTIKIRHLMKQAKEREAQKEREKLEKNQPVKALWKSDKYKDVPSKLRESLQQQQPMAPRAEGTHEFLRAHSKTGSISRPQSARPSSAQSNASATSGKYASKDDIDFVKQNRAIVTQFKLKKAPSVEQLKQVQEKLKQDLDKYNEQKKGKVPGYIEARKQEIQRQEQEFIKNMPDPDQPPGHRKLSDEERKQTLQLLQEKHQNLLSELNSLPIRNDTFRMVSAKTDMEKKLAQLDEAIKIFSKPKVFVKIDS